jgi:hypothetical protein
MTSCSLQIEQQNDIISFATQTSPSLWYYLMPTRPSPLSYNYNERIASHNSYQISVLVKPHPHRSKTYVQSLPLMQQHSNVPVLLFITLNIMACFTMQRLQTLLVWTTTSWGTDLGTTELNILVPKSLCNIFFIVPPPWKDKHLIANHIANSTSSPKLKRQLNDIASISMLHTIVVVVTSGWLTGGKHHCQTASQILIAAWHFWTHHYFLQRVNKDVRKEVAITIDIHWYLLSRMFQTSSQHLEIPKSHSYAIPPLRWSFCLQSIQYALVYNDTIMRRWHQKSKQMQWLANYQWYESFLDLLTSCFVQWRSRIPRE